MEYCPWQVRKSVTRDARFLGKLRLTCHSLRRYKNHWFRYKP